MAKLLKWLENWSKGKIKYGVGAMLLAIPLYPKFPLFDLPGVAVSIRLEDFLILIVLVLWFFSVLPQIRSLIKDPIIRAIVVFLLIGLFSVLAGAFLTKTLTLHVGLLHWARRIEYMSCFVIGLSSIRKVTDISFYLKILVIVVIVATAVGAGQKYLNWPVITTQNQEYSRGVALRYIPGGHLVSTFAGHYDMASYLVLVLPVLYVLLFSPKTVLEAFVPIKAFLLRIILALVILSGLWLLVNAASRISIVAYLGSVSLALLLSRKVKFIPLVVVISLIFTSFSSNLIDRYTRIIEVTVQELLQKTMSFETKIGETSYVYAADEEAEIPKRRERPGPTPAPAPEVFEDRSTSIRLNVSWPRAIRALKKNPLYGTGYSSLTLATDNGYLRLLGEVGILGFVGFTLVGIRIFLVLLKTIPMPKKPMLDNIYVVGIFSAIPGILLIMMFIDILEASKLASNFWLFVGLAVALVRIKEKKNV